MSIDRRSSPTIDPPIKQLLPDGVIDEIRFLKEVEFHRGKIERAQLRETMNRILHAEQTIVEAFSSGVDVEKEWASGFQVSIPLTQANKERLVHILLHLAVLFGYRYELNEAKVDSGLELLQIETKSDGAILKLGIWRKNTGIGFHVTHIDVIPPPVPEKLQTEKPQVVPTEK